MKLFLSVVCICLFGSLLADELPVTSIERSEVTGLKTITGEELKKMIDDRRSFLLLDARKMRRGGMIPGSQSLPYNVNDGEIKAFLRDYPKDGPIIVYCANIRCPVSKYLGKRLILLGYSNVYKYAEGLAGWVSLGYPVDNVAAPTQTH